MNGDRADRTSEKPAAGAGATGVSASHPAGRIEYGNLEIRIDRDGLWFYHGSPIARKELVRYFTSLLRRDEAGAYWLESPYERGRIEVEDVAFLAVELTVEGDGHGRKLIFRTNIDENVIAGRDHPIRVAEDSDTGEPAPYVMVRDGLEARMTRAVYYDLVELAEPDQIEGQRQYGVWSEWTFFPIGSLTDAT
jgi:hypothetical protein